MISVDLARRLRDAGVRWTPVSGDRFVVTDRDMDNDVFVLSDMTIEVHRLPEGEVIGFNGTTEWALDSVESSNALWLPRESQLRELLAGCFQRLERGPEEWWLTVAVNDRTVELGDPDVGQLYGRALLELLTG